MGGRLRTPLALAAAGALLGLAACTGGATPGGPASPSPSEAASVPATSPATSGSPSPSATLDTLPAKQCLTGTWTLVRFVATSNQTYGTGQGGDVTVTFSGARYTLAGAGDKPVQLTLAGSAGNLTVDGRVTGTDRLESSTATFSPTGASGSGVLEVGGRTQRLPMKQVASVIGLEGMGEVACTSSAMTITFPTVRLELARD